MNPGWGQEERSEARVRSSPLGAGLRRLAEQVAVIIHRAAHALGERHLRPPAQLALRLGGGQVDVLDLAQARRTEDRLDINAGGVSHRLEDGEVGGWDAG